MSRVLWSSSSPASLTVHGLSGVVSNLVFLPSITLAVLTLFSNVLITEIIANIAGPLDIFTTYNEELVLNCEGWGVNPALSLIGDRIQHHPWTLGTQKTI